MPSLIQALEDYAIVLEANTAALLNHGIILQDTVSFLLGAFTAIAFVLAADRF